MTSTSYNHFEERHLSHENKFGYAVDMARRRRDRTEKARRTIGVSDSAGGDMDRLAELTGYTLAELVRKSAMWLLAVGPEVRNQVLGEQTDYTPKILRIIADDMEAEPKTGVSIVQQFADSEIPTSSPARPGSSRPPAPAQRSAKVIK